MLGRNQLPVYPAAHLTDTFIHFFILEADSDQLQGFLVAEKRELCFGAHKAPSFPSLPGQRASRFWEFTQQHKYLLRGPWVRR